MDNINTTIVGATAVAASSSTGGDDETLTPQQPSPSVMIIQDVAADDNLKKKRERKPKKPAVVESNAADGDGEKKEDDKKKKKNHNKNNKNNQQQNNDEEKTEGGDNTEENREKKKKTFLTSEELSKKISEIKAKLAEHPKEQDVQDKLKKIQKTIEDKQDQVEKINQKLSKANEKVKQLDEVRKGLFEEVSKYKNIMNENRNEKDRILVQINQIEQEIVDLNDSIEEFGEEVKKSKFRSADEIGREIYYLSEKQQTETLSIKEEEVILRKIKTLTTLKNNFEKLLGLKRQVRDKLDSKKELKLKIQGLHSSVKDKADERQKYFDLLDDNSTKKKAAVEEKKKLEEQLKNIKKEIKNLFDDNYQNQSTLRKVSSTQQRQKDSLEKLEERLQNQKQFEHKKSIREKRIQEKKARENVLKETSQQWAEAKEPEQTKNLYEEEIKICDNLLDYLQKLRSNKKLRTQKLDLSTLQGNKKPNMSLPTLQHPVDKFNQLSSLRITVPKTVDDVPSTIEAVEKLRRSYRVKSGQAEAIEPANILATFAPITTVSTSATAEILDIDME